MLGWDEQEMPGFRVDQSGCGLPGEQGGNFQGPFVLTEQWEGRLAGREGCLPEGFGWGEAVRG